EHNSVRVAAWAALRPRATTAFACAASTIARTPLRCATNGRQPRQIDRAPPSSRRLGCAGPRGDISLKTIVDRLAGITPQRLRGMRRGIEKESLRVLPTGALALTPHPLALGSALTHARITTDFSESQLELITGAHGDV